MIWNNILSKKFYTFPENIIPASKYVNGPKEIELFLSQVGIVNNKEDGNKYQKELMPGQILVSKVVNYGDGMVCILKMAIKPLHIKEL